MKLSMAKKLLLFVLSLIMCASCITACSGSNDEPGESETQAQTEPETDPAIPDVTETVLHRDTGDENIDYILEIPADRAPVILQVTDTQMIRLSGARGDRYEALKNVFFSGTTSGPLHSDETRTWDYVKEGIARANPDMIVLTGDNIYGESDDNGSLWTDFCNKMDSYKIPWAVVWGNHDNESQKGVQWQIAQVEASQYGIIKKGDYTVAGGNSDFNVAIKQGGKIRYVCYMMDTNGAKIKTGGESLLAGNPDLSMIKQTGGIHEEQYAWIQNSYRAISAVHGEVPTMWFMHIPPQELAQAWEEKYPDAPDRPTSTSPFIPDQEGDMGKAMEGKGSFEYPGGLLGLMQETHCSDVFVGHQHINAASVVWNGIRFTFGLKTGTYDYFDYSGELLGTTMIKIYRDSDKTSVTYQNTRLPLMPVSGPGYQ